jgi:hypothetical protein
MRVTMEDVMSTITLCIIMIFMYNQGYADAAWSATVVAFGMRLIFFKCRLELCYLTEDMPV